MSATNIIQKGRTTLVEKLDLQRSAQFVLLPERGQSNSVKEIREFTQQKA